jgi:amino acid permease
MLTLLADDWVASLDPGWHSTGFTFVWMAGQAVAGLALALLGGLANGAQPAAAGSAERQLGIDWGNLMMATLLFWCYVAFAQYLIIWAGNLPTETSWFRHRADAPWFWVPAVLAIFSFVLPFLLLLSRRYKASAGGLAVVAVMLLLGQGLYTAWLILPSASHISPASWLLVLTLLVAGAGAGLNCYGAKARKFRKPVL